MVARLVTLRDRLQHTFLALLGLALLVPVVRIVRRATRPDTISTALFVGSN
jgi:hypothetical protein